MNVLWEPEDIDSKESLQNSIMRTAHLIFQKVMLIFTLFHYVFIFS